MNWGDRVFLTGSVGCLGSVGCWMKCINKKCAVPRQSDTAQLNKFNRLNGFSSFSPEQESLNPGGNLKNLTGFLFFLLQIRGLINQMNDLTVKFSALMNVMQQKIRP